MGKKSKDSGSLLEALDIVHGAVSASITLREYLRANVVSRHSDAKLSLQSDDEPYKAGYIAALKETITFLQTGEWPELWHLNEPNADTSNPPIQSSSSAPPVSPETASPASISSSEKPAETQSDAPVDSVAAKAKFWTKCDPSCSEWNRWYNHKNNHRWRTTAMGGYVEHYKRIHPEQLILPIALPS